MSGLRFAFVQFEFTHAIGPDSGRYVAAADPDGPRNEDGIRSVASADVLLVSVVGARAPTLKSKLGSRSWRRVQYDESQANVPVALATMVRGREPFATEKEAAAQLDHWRESEAALGAAVDDALALVNRAIRAHRAAVGDAYLSEVLADDARSVRIGYGTGEDLASGRWEVAYGVPRPQRLFSTRGRLGPTGAVAAVLRGEDEVLEMEDALLRAAVDLDQGRIRLAAQQVRAAAALATIELRGIEDLYVRAEALAARTLVTPVPAVRDELLVLADALVERLRSQVNE